MLDLDALGALDVALAPDADAVAVLDRLADAPIGVAPAQVSANAAHVCPHLAQMAAE
jgi:hypothetical protein